MGLKKVSIVSLLLLLLGVFGLSQTPMSIHADTLTYEPITILVDRCSAQEDQTLFFDVMIPSETNGLKSSVNDMYLAEYPDGEGYAYHTIEGYTSYLAYYPDAEFASVNCYLSVYSFMDTDIDTYILVVFDTQGDLVYQSDVQDIIDVGYNDSLDQVSYYLYDPVNQTFNIVQETVEVTFFAQMVDFLGSLILMVFVYIVLALIGLVPFMIYSKKEHKPHYISVLLIANAFLCLSAALMINFDIFGTVFLGVMAFVYVLALISAFIILNKKYNNQYGLTDIFVILSGYGLFILIGIRLLGVI